MKTLSVKKLSDKKVVGAGFIFLFFLMLCAWIYLFTNNKISFLYNDGYEPDQPIPFSHKLHAGQYQIDCLYCHAGVEVTNYSPLPSLEVCMNCHRVVKTDSPWIKKLTEAYIDGQSIPWEKVHLLPDFVKFSHYPHILAGKDCRVCHGPVETMERVYQYKSFSMGECVNCHRQPMDTKKVSIFSKDEDYKYSKDLKTDTVHQAPVNCTTCHY